MRQILKHKLEAATQGLPWGAGARVVHVAAQRPSDDFPTVWIEYATHQVDAYILNGAAVHRGVHVVGTGHKFDDTGLEHLGSAVCDDGRLVWHVYAEPA